MDLGALRVWWRYEPTDAGVRATHDYMDAGGTSPWKGEGRTMQEQLSRVTQEQLPRRQSRGAIVENCVGNNNREAESYTWMPTVMRVVV
jgi:hypothetical protein